MNTASCKNEMLENIDSLYTDVFTYVLSRCDDALLAEDITQESMIRVIKACELTEIREPVALAKHAAKNLLTDHWRKTSKRKEHEVSYEPELKSWDTDPERIIAGRSDVACVEKALRKMPAKRREIIWRRRYHGESCAEIASSLNLSVKAVEKHITQALQDLSKALKKIIK